MNFFGLPKWVVWVLVALAVVALCVLWQWRRAVALLDLTNTRLDQEREKRLAAEEAVAAARRAAQRTAELAESQRKLREDLVVRLKKIEDDKVAAAEAARCEEEQAKAEVESKGSAIDAFNSWKERK